MNNKVMTLGRVIGKIPGNQFVMVRDYISESHYADGTAEDTIGKVLDYNMDLRNAMVYGISIEGNNIICIDVLKEE